MKNFSLFTALLVVFFGSVFAQDSEVETQAAMIQNESTESTSTSLTSTETENNSEELILLCCGECSGNDKDD